MTVKATSDSHGFSLIELLAALAIFSIVISLSVGTYRDYMKRTNRADATTLLLRVAAAQERYYLSNNEYAEQDDLDDLGFPGGISEREYYTLVIETPADGPQVGYTARALAAAGGTQATDTDCQELTIDEKGIRDSAPKSMDVCWH